MHWINMFIGCFFLISVNVFCQSVQTDWVKTYNGPGNYEDIINAMLVDNSGNVFITGQSIGIGSEYDYSTIKYSPDGELLWINRYNFPGNWIGYDIPTAIAMDSAGFIYVTGYCWELSSSRYVAITIKYNTDGDTIWTRKFGGEGSDLDWVQPPLFVNTDRNNNLYITGTVDTDLNSIITANVIFTVKYNPDGDALWTRLYHNPQSYLDVASAMAIDNDGNPCIAGICQNPNNPTYNRDIQVIKYNTDGDSLWAKTYSGPANSHDQPNAIAIDGDDNIYVTGSSLDSYEDLVTIKYDKDGNEKWVSEYKGYANRQDEGNAITVDASGFIYVTGSSYIVGTFEDILTIKYNPFNGDTIWTKKYSGSGNYYDAGKAIASDDQNNIYVTGFEYASASGNDIVTIKYDQDGNRKWIQKYAQPWEEEANLILMGKNKEVYVAGKTSTDSTYWDYIVIKYLQDPSGVEQNNTLSPEEYRVYQNYPNPFNPSTKIRYSIPNVGSGLALTVLKIYDVLGNEVATLVDEYKPAGSYEIEFNGNNLASGIYFCRMQAGSYVSIKKMMLLK
ncbi:MAG: hypothetical protein KatS3mg036_0350 [Ignavibacterium sp.]|uniref:SBBP repeat-containing protein n=1 Tax=Ignavibacterium sp. TaxID=2651167 RepID=UPI0021DF3A93|nr:SBBP repeat-containing protein [Ignavibacterium sp.]BDQ03649.1 MAG: hypothetical protein KatS3mg037_2224 [Ignavibacterium sp.]GIV45532.1 MAG: hypothetical protein KatS3mg036_0350 [Ignavibacterium sp.]